MMIVRVFEDADQVAEIEVPHDALKSYMSRTEGYGFNPTEAALAFSAPEFCPFDCDSCHRE